MEWGAVNTESKENAVIILHTYMVHPTGSCGFRTSTFVNSTAYSMLPMLRLVPFRKMVLPPDKIPWLGYILVIFGIFEKQPKYKVKSINAIPPAAKVERLRAFKAN